MTTLATVGFGLNFWAWSLLGPLGPDLRERFGLGPSGHAMLLVVPLVVGSLGRIPVGVLTDRYGARVMFPAVSLLAAVPVVALAFADSLATLIAVGCAAGIGGTAFAIGAPLVAHSSPRAHRGRAVGMFSIGSVGAAAAGISSQWWFGADGSRHGALVLGTLLICYAVLAALLIDDRGTPRVTDSLLAACAVVLRAPVARTLSLLYAVSFGGIVALGLYLPAYLRTVYHLSWEPAVLRTAGFVAVAAAARALGGNLADRWNALGIQIACFTAAAPLGLLMALQPPAPVATAAIFGLSACLGTASGALLALVCTTAPEDRVGAVTGVVGAVGGLGGLLPPLALGAVYGLDRPYGIGLTALAAALLAAAGYLWAHGARLTRALAQAASGPVLPDDPAPPQESAPPLDPTTSDPAPDQDVVSVASLASDGPAHTTVVALNAEAAHRGGPAALAAVTAVAGRDEVVVVYGHTEAVDGQLSPRAFVAALRESLPRGDVVAVLVDAAGGPMRAECALLEDLVSVGVVPVVIAVTPDPVNLATELAKRLRADRVLCYPPSADAELHEVWRLDEPAAFRVCA